MGLITAVKPCGADNAIRKIPHRFKEKAREPHENSTPSKTVNGF